MLEFQTRSPVAQVPLAGGAAADWAPGSSWTVQATQASCAELRLEGGAGFTVMVFCAKETDAT
jgi:hypothetical protein